MRTFAAFLACALFSTPAFAEGVIIPPPCREGTCNYWPYQEPFDPELLDRQLSGPRRPLPPLCMAKCRLALWGRSNLSANPTRLTQGYFGCFHPQEARLPLP